MSQGNICVSICAGSLDEANSKIARAEEVADIVEVRFDCFAAGELDAALASLRSSKPLIATYRSPDQGGRTHASYDQRRTFWSNLPPGYFAVDLEDDLYPRLAVKAKRILSFHDHSGVPKDLGEVVKRMRATDADFIKVAVLVEDAVEAIPLWKLIEDDARIIPIAMGAAGVWTRVLGPSHGVPLTYASLAPDEETAPGQVTALDLVNVYRSKELNRETSVCAVIGDPVSGSKSPYLHNAAFAAAGLNSVFVPLEVKDLAAFLSRMVLPGSREVDLNFLGFAVTMPHKQAIIPHLDEIDAVARKIGAVNTVKIEGDELIGFNTDAHGFIIPLVRHLGDLTDMRIAVLGAGGAARACAFALRRAKADVTIVSRDAHKASVVAAEFGARSASLGGFAPVEYDVLVNATPMGMTGAAAAERGFGAEELAKLKFVYDLVTSPAKTPLMIEAEAAQVSAIGGLEMLVAQAEMQFRIWTGTAPHEGVMERSIIGGGQK